MFKKAQAAMEFLMTYGWAILVVLVVIGALAYFGVLSPSTLLPEKCAFPISLTCVDHEVGAASLILSLQNGGGRDMNIKWISASSEALGTGSVGVGCHTAAAVVLRNGEKNLFKLDTGDVAGACDFRPTGRDKTRYNISVSYSWVDSPTITHSLSGELLAKKS